ncbi:MAG: DUF1127 domain-containing protein [Pseudomonadota bacterium]
MTNKLTAFIGGSARTAAARTLKNLTQTLDKHRAVRRLQGMSDRMLDDIGVSRNEIYQRVLHRD